MLREPGRELRLKRQERVRGGERGDHENRQGEH